MTKREKFIQCVQKEIFHNDDIYMEQYDAEDWKDIVSYWNEFNKTDKSKNTEGMTELGQKILQFMQTCENAMTAKEIGEGLFMSSRSVSGAMRKLITCGYVVRQNANPVMYALTDLGKSYNS